VNAASTWVVGCGTRAAKSLAKVPWRLTGPLPLLPQRRMRLLLGAPPLGGDGVWSALDPRATYDQEPSPALVGLALDAAREAAGLRLERLEARASDAGSRFAGWVNQYPGEHYRLLAAFCRVMRPRTIVEIGTYTGASALALVEASAADARVVTYDIIPAAEIEGSLLAEADFADGRLEQRIGDLAQPAFWASEQELFGEADIVFLDGPKDGVFEPHMLEKLANLDRTRPFLLVVDDIRFLEMLEPWARFPSPKLDLTSFGHWSGTGVALVGE
ncbi:MAG: O-methyltransferase, partial [Acidimicrobiales bacterium]